MQGQIHCQILSTIETIEVQPDIPFQNQLGTGDFECRICLEETKPLIMPCKCDGTMKYVHQKCLKKWASQRVRKQIQKQQQKVKGKLSSIHGVQCQLCKYLIAMEVKKKKKIQSWTNAKQNAQNFFLPFLPLVIVNTILSLISAGAIVFIIIFSFLLLCKNQAVQYQKYEQHPIIIWCILCISFLFSLIFLLKSVVQLYHIFIKQEYEIIRIINCHQVLTEQQSVASKKSISQITNLKQFKLIQNGSTPSTPMNDESVFQNKLSLTRKRINQQRKLAKQIAKRKLLELKQSPKLSCISSHRPQTVQTGTSNNSNKSQRSQISTQLATFR